HGLSLSAGERFRLTIEQFFNSKNGSGITHALLDFSLAILPQLQAKSHVIEDAHVRIERVILEYHRDIAVLRRDVVDPALADVNVAARNFFQAGDHAKSRRFAATGRTNQHNELAIGNFEIHIVDCSYAASLFCGINLVNVINGDLGHCVLRRAERSSASYRGGFEAQTFSVDQALPSTRLKARANARVAR